jgi:hypothetical protein
LTDQREIHVVGQELDEARRKHDARLMAERYAELSDHRGVVPSMQVEYVQRAAMWAAIVEMRKVTQ